MMNSEWGIYDFYDICDLMNLVFPRYDLYDWLGDDWLVLTHL